MVYWFATGIVPPAVCYSCWYLWRAGTESQLRSMKLSEDTDVTAFSGVMAGFATLVGTYGAVSATIGPLVAAPEKKVLPGQQAKVESVSEFARLAGPATIVRGAGLFLGIYAAGRVKTWLSCRHLEPKAAEPKAKASPKANGTRATAKDKQRAAT